MAILTRTLSLVLALLSGGLLGYGVARLSPSETPAPSVASVPRAPVQGPPAPADLDRSIAIGAAQRPPGSPESNPSLPSDPTARASAPERTSAWTIRQDASAITGLTDVFVSLESDDAIACGGRPAVLLLRCLNGQMTALIGHGCQIPADGNRTWPVDLRMDDTPTERQFWLPDASGETLGRWNDREARAFIDPLLSADMLHVRFQDGQDAASEMSFSLVGLDEVLPRLRTACAWRDGAPWSMPQPNRDVPLAVRRPDLPEAPRLPISRSVAPNDRTVEAEQLPDLATPGEVDLEGRIAEIDLLIGPSVTALNDGSPANVAGDANAGAGVDDRAVVSGSIASATSPMRLSPGEDVRDRAPTARLGPRVRKAGVLTN
ncbi:MAG: type VI secretion system-associated protein TagO [Pseudomonadota bacterium]